MNICGSIEKYIYFRGHSVSSGSDRFDVDDRNEKIEFKSP